jgi:hypothetical protein
MLVTFITVKIFVKYLRKMRIQWAGYQLLTDFRNICDLVRNFFLASVGVWYTSENN